MLSFRHTKQASKNVAGTTFKDYLVRAALPKTNETVKCQPRGKKTYLVCNSIGTAATFITEACGEIFKI